MVVHQVLNSYHNNYNVRIWRNSFFDSHFHGNYELIYCIEGAPEVTVNGISETLSPGEMIMIPPYAVHSLQTKNTRTWVGVFAGDYIASFDRKHQYTCFSKFRCDPQIEAFLQTHLFRLEQPEKYLFIGCLYMVCNECIKNAIPYASNLNYTFMYDVITYISENIRQELSMKNLADAMNYEYHYFSSLFHKCFSINFKSFINIFRFEKACNLLSGKDLTSTQIAEECGFGSVRNFNRVFKDLSGFTPNEYRKQQQ